MWTFESSTGSRTYETLKWSDGSTSCDCPGWTRRCVDGQRTCKHVRLVEAGKMAADAAAVFNAPVGSSHTVAAPVATATKPVLKQSTFARKFV